ncbi:MAG TPA: serine O-acetyltransferase EpsC [Vicinamibacterales bacterium]
MSAGKPPVVDRVALSPIVEALCRGARELAQFPGGRIVLPSREGVGRVLDDLRSILFPGYFGTSDLDHESLEYFVGAALARAMRHLEEEIRRGVAFIDRHDYETCAHCGEFAARATKSFLARVPEILDLVHSDVDAAYEGDPALRHRDEAIFAYPGLFAITNQRIAHVLHLLGVPLIPRIITEQAHAKTGIDIHPGAAIGRKFFIDHGTGVVIGETAIVGDRVRLYQGVTLGAKSFPLDARGQPVKGILRHPIVEDDVVIYAGATILGRITIGKGSSIGGNVWLTRDVPAGSRVTQAQVRDERHADGSGI